MPYVDTVKHANGDGTLAKGHFRQFPVDPQRKSPPFLATRLCQHDFLDSTAF